MLHGFLGFDLILVFIHPLGPYASDFRAFNFYAEAKAYAHRLARKRGLPVNDWV